MEENEQTFGIKEFIGSSCATIVTFGGAALLQIQQRKWLEEEYWQKHERGIKELLAFNQAENQVKEKMEQGLPFDIKDRSWIIENSAAGDLYNMQITRIGDEIEAIRNNINPRIVWGGIALAAGAACLTGYVMMQMQEEPDSKINQTQPQQKIITMPAKHVAKTA